MECSAAEVIRAAARRAAPFAAGNEADVRQNRFLRFRPIGRYSAEDTRGGFNQPNNHSKLTDSNNCTVFSFSFRSYCFCCDAPPPCVFCRSPSAHVVIRRQGNHVKRVSEHCATYLRNDNFSAAPTSADAVGRDAKRSFGPPAASFGASNPRREGNINR